MSGPNGVPQTPLRPAPGRATGAEALLTGCGVWARRAVQVEPPQPSRRFHLRSCPRSFAVRVAACPQRRSRAVRVWRRRGQVKALWIGCGVWVGRAACVERLSSLVPAFRLASAVRIAARLQRRGSDGRGAFPGRFFWLARGVGAARWRGARVWEVFALFRGQSR